MHRRWEPRRRWHVRVVDIEFCAAFHGASTTTRLPPLALRRCSRAPEAEAAAEVRGAPAARRERASSPRTARHARPRLIHPARVARHPISPRAKHRLSHPTRSECACCAASPEVSEHAEPVYYRPEPRPQASASSRTRCALAVGHRRLVLMRLLMRVHVDGVDGVDGGVCGGRSGRLAAGPSPPVPGPSTCSRAPAAAAFWRRAVALHATWG